MILSSGIGFRILGRPTDRISESDFRIKVGILTVLQIVSKMSYKGHFSYFSLKMGGGGSIWLLLVNYRAIKKKIPKMMLDGTFAVTNSDRKKAMLPS